MYFQVPDYWPGHTRLYLCELCGSMIHWDYPDTSSPNLICDGPHELDPDGLRVISMRVQIYPCLKEHKE
jgi:hypothetical protein